MYNILLSGKKTNTFFSIIFTTFFLSNVALGGWADLGNMWKKIGRYSHIQIQYWNSWKSCQTSCTLFTKGQRVGQCSVITVLVFMNILSNLMHPTIGLWDGSMFSVHRTGIHEHLVKPHAPYIPKGNGMGQCSVFIVTETCFEIVENLPGSMGNQRKKSGAKKSGKNSWD